MKFCWVTKTILSLVVAQVTTAILKLVFIPALNLHNVYVKAQLEVWTNLKLIWTNLKFETDLDKLKNLVQPNYKLVQTN